MLSNPATPQKLAAVIAQDTSPEPVKGSSLFALGVRKFRGNKMAVFSCIVIILLYGVSTLATWFAPYSFDDGDLEAQNLPPTWYQIFMPADFKQELRRWAEAEQGAMVDLTLDMDEEFIERPVALGWFANQLSDAEPGAVLLFLDAGIWQHFMGTDELGQDIMSRVIYGLRLSLLLALTVTLVSVVVGTLYGAVAGFMGGAVDQIMMRFVDFLFGVPFIFLVILLMVFFGREIYLIFIGLGLVYWIVLARIVRGQILALKHQDFILAAHSQGVPRRSLILRHLIPNVLGPVVVFSTLLVPQIMLLEAFLSFIGLGVSPPDVSLGILLSDGAAVVTRYSWPMIYPGIVFSLTIFCMNFIGDGLRDAFDPKSLP